MNITLSENDVTSDDVDGAIASGKNIADITEVVMDRQFVVRSRHDWCWLSGEHLPSALHAAKTKGPLALYIGDEYEDRRLSALYLCGPDVLARVAQK